MHCVVFVHLNWSLSRQLLTWALQKGLNHHTIHVYSYILLSVHKIHLVLKLLMKAKAIISFMLFALFNDYILLYSYIPM